MTKLTIFKAAAAPIALIVRKSAGKKQNWQLIKWDMDSNTFTEGQWLMNKQLWLDGCAISENGEYLYWIYNQYQSKENDTHAGISHVPNFTAIMYGNGGCGRWDACRFDDYTGKPINNQDLVAKSTDVSIECVSSAVETAPNGRMPDIWEDIYGDCISVEDYKVLVNGKVVYDATSNVYTSIK